MYICIGKTENSSVLFMIHPRSVLLLIKVRFSEAATQRYS